MSKTKTLFITGVSTGFGKALAQQALAAGHKVIGTLRNPQALADFEAQAPGRAHGVLLDVTEFSAIDSVINDVDTAYGPVDVLVNNAGYGHEGILEESSLDDLRQQFDVNVYGAVAIIKAFAPLFRQRRTGHIINITSMGGFITMPGIPITTAASSPWKGSLNRWARSSSRLMSLSRRWLPVGSAPTGPAVRCSVRHGRSPITT
jgi:NAD(P)-dependent dehydrogenase (short-subunit alcohol dehydrogenase family)